MQNSDFFLWLHSIAKFHKYTKESLPVSRWIRIWNFEYAWQYPRRYQEISSSSPAGAMKIFLWIRYKHISSFIAHDISWKKISLFLTPTVFFFRQQESSYYICFVLQEEKKRKKKGEKRRKEERKGHVSPKFGTLKKGEAQYSRNLIRVTTRNSSDCTRNARCIKAD